jgi:hypothetical protein
MLGKWEPEKVVALAAAFKSLPDDKKLDLAQFINGQYFTANSPLKSEALAYLVTHPAELNYSRDPFADPTVEGNRLEAIKLATEHALEIGKESPETAGEWIQSLPDGDAKFYAAKNLKSVWSLYDPEAAERWLKSLPAATRAKVRDLK